MVEQRHVPVALAAGDGVMAAKACVGAFGPVVECGEQRAMPIATVAGGEPRRTVDSNIGKWRLDAHLDRIPREIERKDKAHALEVDGERVRADVVGSQRLAVERRRIVSSDVEPSPVQHQVATDGREAGGAKAGDELAELLEGDFRIAAAFEHKI